MIACAYYYDKKLILKPLTKAGIAIQTVGIFAGKAFGTTRTIVTFARILLILRQRRSERT